MRIVRYLLQHKVALLVVFALLVVQAACDLALPTYTSDIVDVGIQQGGVEDVAPAALTAESYEAIACMLPTADEETFRASYDWDAESGCYQLNAHGYDQRTQLNSMMALPLVVLHTEGLTGDFSVSDLTAAYQAGLISKDQILAGLDTVRANMGDASDALLQQQGISAAKAEYAATGTDTNALQMDYLLRTGGIMLGMAALSMLVSVLIGFVASRTGTRIGQTLREKLFTQVLSFSDAEINSFSAASLITRGTNDIQLIQMICIMLQRMVLYAPIVGIGGVVLVAQRTLSLWWIVALAVVAVIIVVVVLFAVTMPKFKIVQKLIDKVNLVAREMLTGMPVVRAFGREAYEENRFEGANFQLMRTQLFTNRAMAFMMPAMTLIMNLTSVLIVWVGGHFVDAGTLQTGDLIALITYSMMIVMSFLTIGMVAIMLPRASVAAARVDEVIACEPSIVDPAGAGAGDDATSGATITFDDVSFRYDDTSDYVLEHVSFTAEAGQTCAIIGPTGSGKSTIVKLIERFHDVSEGRVLLDGTDVRDMPQHALRAQLGYVPQKAFLFEGTVESNVDYGGNTSEERRNLALEVSQSAGFVAEKEDGLHSEISQGGTNVSGGQRQRLAIARALATDARAYLFDDSFSALDYKTDVLLRQGLSTRLVGRTVLIVAQRIATIMHADNIVVLDEGRVVGQGTHAQLLESCEAYREIALSQLSERELFGQQAAAAQPVAPALEGGECHE
ncbi:MAG: ABC transporter ATP-binding protein [Coriobacteriia bacterium]|nr:ABC transporter ATP-binding protein [Coriobacteriia bacterium]